jgi:hypothetical protein
LPAVQARSPRAVRRAKMTVHASATAGR